MAARDTDMFDLEGRTGGPERPPVGRMWTAEEQAEKLAGYVEIDREFWDKVRYGTHMRYFSTAGEFRVGGFVVVNPSDAPGRAAGDIRRSFRLQNGFNSKARGYAQWSAAYEDVGRVFIKPGAFEMMTAQSLASAVAKLNANDHRIADHVREHAAEIAALSARVAELEHRRA
jgi:hypothetical protein